MLSNRIAVEERLRDKLTSAARDKLAAAAKEKQLQAERKRKAAMFISMLKGTPASAQGTADSQLAGEWGLCHSLRFFTFVYHVGEHIVVPQIFSPFTPIGLLHVVMGRPLS